MEIRTNLTTRYMKILAIYQKILKIFQPCYVRGFRNSMEHHWDNRLDENISS